MQKFQVSEIGGIDRRPEISFNGKPGEAQRSAFLVKNLTYNPKKKSWNRSNGWLAYLYSTPGIQTEDCYSLGYFGLKAGAKGYILSEREQVSGQLLLEYIDPLGSTGQQTLKTGRHLPSQEDWGTTYIPFGNFCLIINGVDSPLKYFGNSRIEPFGFSTLPSQPQPFSPAGAADLGTVAQIPYASIEDGGDMTIAVWSGNTGQNIIGMGDPDISKPNSYAYRVSYVSDTGSESPLSEPSYAVKWNNGDGSAGHTYKYGIVVDNISIGPEGTVKRRIYRTQNLGNGVTGTATFYFLDDVPNNVETTYNDIIPDSYLGSEAPNFSDSGLLPIGCNVGTAFAGRIILGGGIANPTRLFYSTTLGPEQFPENNYIDCSQREGDEITGLIPYNNLLIVLRKSSIEALVPTGNEVTPFFITPIYNGIGCTAPKTAKVVTGFGLVFLGTDGFYALTGNYSNASQIKVQIMSDTLNDFFTRINVQAMARACATYNVADNEYWCQVPIDGSSTPNSGLVFHAPIEAWSIREAVPAQALIQIQEGWTVFGSNSNLLGNKTPNGNTRYPFSWGVWCGTTTAGYSSGNFLALHQMPPSAISTAWLDFGNVESEKNIKSVTFYCLSTSILATPEVTVYRNYDWDGTQTNGQIGDVIQDQIVQPVYNVAKFGIDTWTNSRLSSIRADFSIPASRVVRFEINSGSSNEGGSDVFNMQILGFSVEYDETGVTQVWTANFDAFTGKIPKVAGGVPASYLPPTVGII